VGASALAPYLYDLPLRFMAVHGTSDAPGMRIEPVSIAQEQLCDGDGPEEPRTAGERRRIEPGQRRCRVTGEAGDEKTLIGHEVAFLVRAVRSGPLPLSARAIFLALARQVPDPSHPEILVENPYRLWSDIDPTLPSDPIRVLGPAPSSQPGSALLSVLMQPGCHRVLPRATEESQCQSVRGDDVYIEVPEYGTSVVRELATHPTWLGLLNLELLRVNRGELAVSPVDDVAPAAQSVLSGAYPAARSLYLYVRTSDLRSLPVLGNLVFRYRQQLENREIGGPETALVSSQELQSQLPSP
jgi:phosphate transport system substrate-binding protein